ncbi:MAG: hypothetical protein AB1505_04315 [Candidatus Latescibacterota bacterium]
MAVACLALAGGAAAQQRLCARVAAVYADSAGTGVVVRAGREQGLLPGSRLSLLREVEPIVHPLTGEVLGVPQEPVGEAVVTRADALQAHATVGRTYSAPAAGDLAEYAPQYAAASPTPRPSPASPPEAPLGAPRSGAPATDSQAAAGAPAQAQGPPPAARSRSREPRAPDPLLERLKELEDDVAEYRRAQRALAAYPVFAEQVWEEVTSVKTHVLLLNERLVQLESRQEEDRGRLGAVMAGRYPPEESEEFTIRYSPRAQVRLRVAGTTLLLDVDVDTLRLQEVSAAAAVPTSDELLAAAGPPSADLATPAPPSPQVEPADTAGEAPPSPGAQPWYRSRHLPVAGFLAAALVGLAVYHVIKRRHDARLAQLEDFDEELLEEDEEEA